MAGIAAPQLGFEGILTLATFNGINNDLNGGSFTNGFLWTIGSNMAVAALGKISDIRIGAKELLPIKGTGYGKKPWYVQVKDYFQFLQTIEEHTPAIQGSLNSLVSLASFVDKATGPIIPGQPGSVQYFLDSFRESNWTNPGGKGYIELKNIFKCSGANDGFGNVRINYQKVNIFNNKYDVALTIHWPTCDLKVNLYAANYPSNQPIYVEYQKSWIFNMYLYTLKGYCAMTIYIKGKHKYDWETFEQLENYLFNWDRRP